MSRRVNLDEIVAAIVGLLLLLSLVGCGTATKSAPASVPMNFWVPQFLDDKDRLCVPAPSGGYCKPVERVREFIAAQEMD